MWGMVFGWAGNHRGGVLRTYNVRKGKEFDERMMVGVGKEDGLVGNIVGGGGGMG